MYGIYCWSWYFYLVNKTSKYAKNNTWISLIAGLFSILNIISYIELSSVFKSNKSEYDYVAATFGKHTGFFIAIVIILVYVLTNTTVSHWLLETILNKLLDLKNIIVYNNIIIYYIKYYRCKRIIKF